MSIKVYDEIALCLAKATFQPMKLLRQNCRQRAGLGEGGEIVFRPPGTVAD